MSRKTAVNFLAVLSIAGSVLAAEKKSSMDTPQISCAGGTQVSRSITVCAPNSGTGSTGLPAGFSLQWMTCDAYAANGDQWFTSDDPRLSKASFSGNANASRYDLAAGGCVTIDIGDFLFDQGASTNSSGSLSCGTCYIFRAFGHATNTLNRSAFTANLNCSTSGCGAGQGDCTFTFTAWKALGPVCDPGADAILKAASATAFTSLTLGTVTYADTRLACILDTPADNNGLIALAHQLIAAKLNAAKNISVPAAVATCISDADALIGGLVIPPLGGGFLDPSATSALTACLLNYNEGTVGPGACLPPDPGQDVFRLSAKSH